MDSKLKNKCDEVGIEYMSTPYDFESLELINQYVNAIKIGSGDITWHQFLREVAKKNKPVMLSTGTSSMNDVNLAVKEILKFNNNVVLMQCSKNYTGSENNFNYINLNVLKEYKKLTQIYFRVILSYSWTFNGIRCNCFRCKSN